MDLSKGFTVFVASSSSEEHEVSCEEAETPMPLLYQSGYLTIERYDPLLRSYVLHFPNLEVRQGMIRGLMPLILNRKSTDTNSLLFKMTDGLVEGDLSGALLAIRSYIAKIPYDIITKEEWNDKAKHEPFYKLLLYFIFSIQIWAIMMYE